METKQVTQKRFKTKLKFKESELTGEPIAFAHWNKITQSLLGVNENDKVKKKICVLSSKLKEKGKCKPGILYAATVHFSLQKNSYIVDTIKQYKFKAKIETQITRKCFYQTIVTIGNEKIYYNPFDGKSEYSRTLSRMLELIENRNDILNKKETIEAIKRSARTVEQYLQADGYLLPSRKKAV